MTLTLVAWISQTVLPWNDVRQLQWFIGVLATGGGGGLVWLGKHIVSAMERDKEAVAKRLDALAQEHKDFRILADVRHTQIDEKHEEIWAQLHRWNTEAQVKWGRLESRIETLLDAQPKPKRKP